MKTVSKWKNEKPQIPTAAVWLLNDLAEYPLLLLLSLGLFFLQFQKCWHQRYLIGMCRII